MAAALYRELGHLKNNNKYFPLLSQQESEIFSNISYLKQFNPKKMGEKALILPNS